VNCNLTQSGTVYSVFEFVKKICGVSGEAEEPDAQGIVSYFRGVEDNPDPRQFKHISIKG